MGGSGGSGGQQYCLRWNNHRSNLLNVFEQLFQSEALTDVTLAVGGTSIKCHKIILAACSGYFRSLFLDNTCPHPIVVFKDIQYAELRAILEFIYRGEVSVAQEHVGALLKAAESLRVKGLYTEEDSTSAMSGLSFEPTSSASLPTNGFHPHHEMASSPHPSAPLPSATSLSFHPTSHSVPSPVTTSVKPATTLPTPTTPFALKRSPTKTPETLMEKEREGSSSSETNPPEEERDDSMIHDTKPIHSPLYNDLKGDLAARGKINRPELKRYRQYTRHDIAAAIDAVRSGMSALQASRLYGVPSRTLYDKVKKLGIVTGRPYRQSIAVAVSLAQQSATGISPRDDDDSLDSGDPRHNASAFHQALGRAAAVAAAAGVVNPLEELGLYFASKRIQTQLPELSELPLPLPAPIDLSQGYERMLRGDAATPHSVADSGVVEKSELIAEKTA